MDPIGQYYPLPGCRGWFVNGYRQSCQPIQYVQERRSLRFHQCPNRQGTPDHQEAFPSYRQCVAPPHNPQFDARQMTSTLTPVPTTAGTGSETTGTAVLDIPSKQFKTAIAHRNLKPTLGIVDTNNTKTCPKHVAISAGLDVLFHALESGSSCSPRR